MLWYLTFGLANMLGLALILLNGYHLIIGGQVSLGLETAFVAVVFLALYLLFHLIVILPEIGLLPEEANEVLVAGLDSPQELATGWFTGFALWYGILMVSATNLFSFLGSLLPVLSLPALFSTTKGAVPEAHFAFANGISAPYVEELFFGIGVPVVMYSILAQAEIGSKLARIAVTGVVSAGLFASFHVDQPVFSAFWIAAFLFAFLLRGLMLADVELNVVPSYAVFITFVMGAHMANNIFQLGGIVEFAQTLAGDSFIFLFTAYAVGVNLLWVGQRLLAWSR